MPEAQVGDKTAISLQVRPSKVFQKPAPASNHFQEAASAVVVFLVGVEVTPKIVDASREDRDLNGLLDEIRISSTARSADWIWAEWWNMASNSAFITFGNVASGMVENLPATSIGVGTATLNGRIVTTFDAENPDVYICWGTNDALMVSTGDWDNVESLGNSWGPGESFSKTVRKTDTNRR